MNPEMENLIAMLKDEDTKVLFNTSGTKLYTLVNSETLLIAYHPTKNFQDMTEEEVKEFIQTILD